MNMMEVNGYKAKIEYDPELDQFRGEILGLNGSADFYGKSPASLRREFKNSLKVYLEVCEEKGIAPTKENIRVSLISGSRPGCIVKLRREQPRLAKASISGYPKF
jgi:hypothetical protein